VTGGTAGFSSDENQGAHPLSNPGETFSDRMIKLVEGASRPKKNAERDRTEHLVWQVLTIIFLLAVVTLQPFAIYFRCTAEHLRPGLTPCIAS